MTFQIRAKRSALKEMTLIAELEEQQASPGLPAAATPASPRISGVRAEAQRPWG